MLPPWTCDFARGAAGNVMPMQEKTHTKYGRQNWQFCAARRSRTRHRKEAHTRQGGAQRTAYGALRIVALRDSRRSGLAAASGQTWWPPAGRVSRRRAHTHREHCRTAPKVIAAWRGRAVACGRRRARFAIRSAAVQQWPSGWCRGSAGFLGHIALFADNIRLAESGQRCVHDLACQAKAQ